MPDITMCKGTLCPLRVRCQRHTATPSERQAYFDLSPFKLDKNLKASCDYLLWNGKGGAMMGDLAAWLMLAILACAAVAAWLDGGLEGVM